MAKCIVPFSKEGTTYKLESPVGVNANLLTRNFSAMEVKTAKRRKMTMLSKTCKRRTKKISDKEYEE
jgi:hypothetical protein